MSDKEKKIVKDQAADEDIQAAPGNEDDDKKEDSTHSFIDFEKSAHFEKAVTKIYDIIFKIYDRNKKNNKFFHDKFDLYSPFFVAFQPGKEYKKNSVKGEAIKAIVTKTYQQEKCFIYPSIYNQNSLNFGKLDTSVKGLLYVTLQNKINGYDNKQLMSEDLIASVDEKYFPLSNVYFALSTERTLKSYNELKTVARIVIHLRQKPEDFWNSLLLAEIVTALLDFDFVSAFKVREVSDFGRGDTFVIYLTVPATEAWAKLENVFDGLLPAVSREDYEMPFATPLGRGINGNIPIRYIHQKKISHASFTQGISTLAKEALKATLTNEGLESQSSFNKPSTTAANRLKNIAHFKTHLIAILRRNALHIDKDGALHQPKPPEIT